MEHSGLVSQEPGSEWRLKPDLKSKEPDIIYSNYDNLLTQNAHNNLLNNLSCSISWSALLKYEKQYAFLTI